MKPDYTILMHHLETLFDAAAFHDWDMPRWLQIDLRRVKAQYDEIAKEEAPDRDGWTPGGRLPLDARRVHDGHLALRR